jgi:acetyltransferase-like isoleucine patch superfamily enzyme
MIQKLRKICSQAYVKLRIWKYNLLSDIYKTEGNPILIQPVLMVGKGKIKFGQNIVLGTNYSPGFYSTYIHLEARTQESFIYIDDEVWTNNNLCIISNGAGISIGNNTLIGYNVEILDSDFHEINPHNRKLGNPKSEKIVIGNNVWLGSNVKVLKGVKIGDNTIISAGSIVTKSIPANVIAGGIPAIVIKNIENFGDEG